MDVAAWLQDLGLERYVPAFRDNDIDAEVLPKLTAEDLISLGVTSVGHRRKLLDAIASLGMAVPTAVVTAPAPGAPAQVDAERRQLTVMFCDLVGSTALSTRHDPEDLRELIADYHRVVSNTVGRFDGFVAKYMGDGVLVYFGYPQAHEDDAERAVRAGRAVIEAVGQLPAREDLSVRLGIATGLAVVGDLIGEGAAQERGVVGETPNLAARLQALAMPNTLVIAEATRRQVGGLFDLADLGPQALAGFAEPQPAWRVIGESGMLSRFEALRSGTTPLVGRDEEVELLIRRWQQAKSGEGRVVLISGEPGIGKSRLTAALSEHIEAEPHTRLRYFCSPHHQDSALYPFIAQLERAAGFARDDTVEAKLGKLRALLAPGARDDDDIALLSELLSLPSSAADLNLSPQRKREKLFEALLQPARSRGAAPAGADGVRGRPLDRSDLARAVGSDRRPGAASAGAARDHLSPRIPAALGRPPPCHEFGAQSAGRTRRRGAGAEAGRQCRAHPRYRRRDRRAHRRGEVVRGSMTVQRMPSASSAVAAVLANCTMRPIGTTVTSVPSRTSFALPKGIAYGSSGTSSVSSHIALCSKKTGSSSRIAWIIRPLAS